MSEKNELSITSEIMLKEVFKAITKRLENELKMNIMFEWKNFGNTCNVMLLNCKDELCNENEIVMIIQLPIKCEEMEDKQIIPIDHIFKKLEMLKQKNPKLFRKIAEETLKELEETK